MPKVVSIQQNENQTLYVTLDSTIRFGPEVGGQDYPHQVPVILDRESFGGVEAVAWATSLPDAFDASGTGDLDAEGTLWNFLEAPDRAVRASEVGAYRWLLDAIEGAGYEL